MCLNSSTGILARSLGKRRPNPGQRKGRLRGASAFCQVAQSGRTSGSYLHWGCGPTGLNARSSSPPLIAPGVRRHRGLSSQLGTPLGDPAQLLPSAATCSNPVFRSRAPPVTLKGGAAEPPSPCRERALRAPGLRSRRRGSDVVTTSVWGRRTEGPFPLPVPALCLGNYFAQVSAFNWLKRGFEFIVGTITETPTFSSVLPRRRGCQERITFSAPLARPERGPWLKLETWARSAASLDPCLFVAFGAGARPPFRVGSKTNFCSLGLYSDS